MSQKHERQYAGKSLSQAPSVQQIPTHKAITSKKAQAAETHTAYQLASVPQKFKVLVKG